MRIAYFSDTFAPEINGVSNTLRKLQQHLQSKHVDHLFVVPDYELESSEESQILAPASGLIRVRSIKAPLYKQSRLAIPSYLKIKHIVDTFAPDVIHVTTPLPIGWCGMKYAKDRNIPLVMSYHTNFDMYTKYYKLEYFERMVHGFLRWFHDHADLNLAPSYQTQQMLIEKGYARVGIWSRGIDCKQFSPAERPAAPFTFLYVGRMAAEKGLDLLADAIEPMCAEYNGNVRFVFTGDGPYLERLNERFSDQIANKQIVLTGFLTGEKLADVYRMADCFVCPSSSETFGNVMLEAMASGLPIICADQGGQLDFARHMHNAILFESEELNSLIQALRTAVKHPHLLERLASTALQTAQQRSWQQIFNKLLQDYEELVAVRMWKEQTIC